MRLLTAAGIGVQLSPHGADAAQEGANLQDFGADYVVFSCDDGYNEINMSVPAWKCLNIGVHCRLNRIMIMALETRVPRPIAPLPHKKGIQVIDINDWNVCIGPG